MDKLYLFNAGKGYIQFISTKEEGEKIVSEINIRRKEEHTRELEFTRSDIQIVTYDTYFIH